jgi:hypothetical protein
MPPLTIFDPPSSHYQAKVEDAYTGTRTTTACYAAQVITDTWKGTAWGRWLSGVTETTTGGINAFTLGLTPGGAEVGIDTSYYAGFLSGTFNH